MKKLSVILICVLVTINVYAIDFLSPSNRVQSNDSAIINLAESITKNKKTTLEKSKAIHLWLTQNIAYDTEIRNKIESGKYTEADYLQDAIVVFETKKAVCEGYANLSAALHRAVGISAKVIYGKFLYLNARSYRMYKNSSRLVMPDVNAVSNLHAWNEILIKDQWMPMDVTSDSGKEEIPNVWIRVPLEEFFNPDAAYFNATHIKTGEFDQ
jgi:transglutaminase-like putative cysteine protease